MREKENINDTCVKQNKVNLVLFDLNLKATKIKNGYLIKDCISALSAFIVKNKNDCQYS